MKRCVSAAGRPVFSIIIDESTDVSCTKVLACAVMYFDKEAQPKFLFTIDLEGEKAVDLFAALSDGLKLNGFDINNMIGFAADTTNVMYDSPAHNILNHYEIRWLSFHCCVARVLEQWDALIAFFQEEYEVDNNLSAEYILSNLKNPTVKLYLLFLDYILALVNKFNIIFQSSRSVVHHLYKTMSEFYKSVLACYMQEMYINNTDLNAIEPTNTFYFVHIKDMYLGIKVETELSTNSLDKEHKLAFLKRSQLFLIELCVQLKKRLPLQDNFLKMLSFLDPNDFNNQNCQSLLKLYERFPDFVNDPQIIDNEYRTMKTDDMVKMLLTKNLNCDTFWYELSQLKDINNCYKYSNISKFAQSMLILPVSNASCERIFSQINLIKTKNGNRFQNVNVSHILHVKQSLRENGCNNFKPNEQMLCKDFNKLNLSCSDEEG
ncbi:uncharacterized protein LOC26527476 [Drosophila mojavensis]|uniref:HAT C-terminal dimerisation domain-containing protein n=1 Tax=Drosophila mojavensis TaxID=7230 RepID=A0A0Q9XHQ6_DROMO|nr:uncharacterized protein LOC26527476 [Drosophila mojavensis]XP_043865171.1 uncharacterized protein LOC26527476 [Drosophila mojavensis]KRG03793.1 uncharacterized protein Dmoj_GI25835 [Drosophila mojavensis]